MELNIRALNAIHALAEFQNIHALKRNVTCIQIQYVCTFSRNVKIW